MLRETITDMTEPAVVSQTSLLSFLDIQVNGIDLPILQ